MASRSCSLNWGTAIISPVSNASRQNSENFLPVRSARFQPSFFLPSENADYPFHHWWLGMLWLEFTPAFYILAVFFQMSESYTLQKTRNIRPVITQATDNELQAFPRGATEIGSLSVYDFMGQEKGFPISSPSSLVVASGWCVSDCLMWLVASPVWNARLSRLPLLQWKTRKSTFARMQGNAVSFQIALLVFSLVAQRLLSWYFLKVSENFHCLDSVIYQFLLSYLILFCVWQ